MHLNVGVCLTRCWSVMWAVSPRKKKETKKEKRRRLKKEQRRREQEAAAYAAKRAAKQMQKIKQWPFMCASAGADYTIKVRVLSLFNRRDWWMGGCGDRWCRRCRSGGHSQGCKLVVPLGNSKTFCRPRCALTYARPVFVPWGIPGMERLHAKAHPANEDRETHRRLRCGPRGTFNG